MKNGGLSIYILDCYVWDAIDHNVKVKNYNSLINEIRNGVSGVPKSGLVRSVQNRSRRILSVLKIKAVLIYTTYV